MSILDEPVLARYALDCTPELRDVEMLTIEELTSLVAEGVQE
jgi:hypothetical protein